MEVVLHLGAHKTATTYFQRLLERNAAMLEADRIAYVPPSLIRRHAVAAERRRRMVRWIWDTGPADLIGRHVSTAEAAGARRVLISEENLLGLLDDVVLGSWFYNQTETHVRRAARALENRPLEVLIAVRCYADFFPSAYAQAIKGRGFAPFDDALHRRLVGMERGWPDVIADITRALPTGARLRIWPYEDMARLEPVILDHMVGSEAASHLAPFRGRPMPGPTDYAIRRLHALSRSEGALTTRRIRHVLRLNSRDKGLAPFDPWTPRERAFLERRYRQDLARIAATWPQAMLDAPDRDAA